MTPEQIALVLDSFADLVAGPGPVAAAFYEQWAARNPTVTQRLALEGPADEVAFELEVVRLLASLPDVAALVRRAEGLGQHRGVAAMRPSDFSTGRLAFLSVLESALGARLDPATRDAWVLAMNLVAECLMGVLGDASRASAAASA